MALKLNERYPGRFSNPTAAYPQGSFKNRTTPDAKDGSYLEKDWANDKEGFFQSLLSAAGLVANGSVDAVGASQYYSALTAIIGTLAPNPPDASTTVKGVVELATNTETQDGVDTTRAVTPATLSARTATETRAGIVELSTNVEAREGTDNTRAVTPWGLASRTATETRTGIAAIATQGTVNAGTDDEMIVTPKKLRFGFNVSLSSNGFFVAPSWLGGWVVQWGVDVGNAGSSKTLNFPLAWPTGMKAISGNVQGTAVTCIAVVFDSSSLTASSITFRANNSSNASVAQGIFWIAVGS